MALGAALVLGAVALVALATRMPLGYASIVATLVAVLLAGLGGALLVQHSRAFVPVYGLGAAALSGMGILSRRVLRYDAIDSLGSGRRAGRLRLPRWHLPGYVVGEIRSSELGPLRAYCTRVDVDALVIVSAGQEHLALSPAEPERFRQELIARLEGAEQHRRDSSTPRLDRSLDPLVAALGCAAVVLVLGSLGVAADALLSSRSPGNGSVSPIDNLLYLALLQLAVIGLNASLIATPGRLEPVARQVLAAAALCVAVVAFVSMLRLVR